MTHVVAFIVAVPGSVTSWLRELLTGLIAAIGSVGAALVQTAGQLAQQLVTGIRDLL